MLLIPDIDLLNNSVKYYKTLWLQSLEKDLLYCLSKDSIVKRMLFRTYSKSLTSFFSNPHSFIKIYSNFIILSCDVNIITLTYVKPENYTLSVLEISELLRLESAIKHVYRDYITHAVLLNSIISNNNCLPRTVFLTISLDCSFNFKEIKLFLDSFNTNDPSVDNSKILFKQLYKLSELNYDLKKFIRCVNQNHQLFHKFFYNNEYPADERSSFLPTSFSWNECNDKLSDIFINPDVIPRDSQAWLMVNFILHSSSFSSSSLKKTVPSILSVNGDPYEKYKVCSDSHKNSYFIKFHNRQLPTPYTAYAKINSSHQVEVKISFTNEKSATIDYKAVEHQVKALFKPIFGTATYQLESIVHSSGPNNSTITKVPSRNCTSYINDIMLSSVDFSLVYKLLTKTKIKTNPL